MTIATPQLSLEAAAEVAREAGVTPVILGDALEGEAAEVGKLMAGIARSVATHGHPAPAPCVLLSGGETTVTVRGGGRGGRNVEFLLALAVALDGLPGAWAIAGDTDGIDGAEEIAGALVTPDTVTRAAGLGIDAKASLARERRSRLLRGPRRPGRDGADADQRQRFPGNPDRPSDRVKFAAE